MEKFIIYIRQKEAECRAKAAEAKMAETVSSYQYWTGQAAAYAHMRYVLLIYRTQSLSMPAQGSVVSAAPADTGS